MIFCKGNINICLWPVRVSNSWSILGSQKFLFTSVCIASGIKSSLFSLSNIGLGELDPDLMQKLENLESLNLSSNQLSKIPLTIELPKLKKLDVSQNALTSLDFISQFPARRFETAKACFQRPSANQFQQWNCKKQIRHKMSAVRVKTCFHF